jgi:hypothetical protein
MPLSLNKNRNKYGTFLTKNLLSNFLNPHLRARLQPPLVTPPEDIRLERFNFHQEPGSSSSEESSMVVGHLSLIGLRTISHLKI